MDVHISQMDEWIKNVKKRSAIKYAHTWESN